MRVPILFLFLFSLNLVAAQVQENADQDKLLTYYKIEDGKLLLRWNPNQAHLWEQGRKNGYLVEKYQYVKEGDRVQPLLKEQFEMFPTGWSDWSKTEGEAATTFRRLIYFEDIAEEELEEDLPLAEYGPAGRLNVFYRLSNHIANSDFDLTNLAGLGLIDADIDPKAKYLYTIKMMDHPQLPLAKVKIDLEAYETPVVPTLKAEFTSSQVNLQWRTYEFRDFYYGYYLERSEDGVKFEVINDAPFINVYDTTTQEALKSFRYTDSLAQNDKTYWVSP